MVDGSRAGVDFCTDSHLVAARRVRGVCLAASLVVAVVVVVRVAVEAELPLDDAAVLEGTLQDLLPLVA